MTLIKPFRGYRSGICADSFTALATPVMLRPPQLIEPLMRAHLISREGQTIKLQTNMNTYTFTLMTPYSFIMISRLAIMTYSFSKPSLTSNYCLR